MSRYIAIILFLFHCISNSVNTEGPIVGIHKESLVVFGVDDCHYCMNTRQFLEKEQILFTFYNVDKNLEKRNEMVSALRKNNVDLTRLNMPVIQYRNKFLLREGELKQFLPRILELIKSEDAAKN